MRALLAIVLAALVVPARAQQVLPPYRLQSITAPVRNAGVLHLASGTWTRKASAAGLGADIVYNNTCSTGVYAGLSGDTFVTNGRVPSPTSPDTLWSKPGCATSYTIDGFQIAYCTDQPVPGVITVSFHNSYDCCASVIGVTPTATFALSGLPGAASGASTCWTVTIDLDSPPQSASLAFTFLADRDGSYDGGGSSGGVDTFGWAFRSSLTGAAAHFTGPLVAGSSYGYCLRFDGTRWDPAVDYDEQGEGMGTCAAFRVEGGTTIPGCYWFGGWPDPNFHLELYSDACPGQPSMTAFCVGDAYGQPTSSPCPCSNSSPGGTATGCRHSFGLGGRLRGAGNPSLASDTLVLSADQLPASTSLLFFQGTQRQAPGTVLGDGLRCAGGAVTRLGASLAVNGAAVYPSAADAAIHLQGQVSAAGLRTYQVWYRNAASFCTPAVFNLTNGLEVLWTP